MTLPEYFLVSETDGHLYDTRKEGWHKLPPLRSNYFTYDIEQHGLKAIKTLIRFPYTFPGGYEIALIAWDGGIICHKCAREAFYQIVYSTMKDIRDGWNIVGITSRADFEEVEYCSHCNKQF